MEVGIEALSMSMLEEILSSVRGHLNETRWKVFFNQFNIFSLRVREEGNRGDVVDNSESCEARRPSGFESNVTVCAR